MQSGQMQVQHDLATVLADIVKLKAQKGGGGWYFPFFILLLMNIGTIVAGILLLGKGRNSLLPSKYM